MRQFILAVVLAALVSLSIQQSPSQTTCFVCPPVDLAGRPLQTHSNSGGELICHYPSGSNDLYCKYFTSTGLLKQDKDQGQCPTVAIVSTCSTRRSALPRSPRLPQPGARAITDTMRTRAKLKRSRPQV